MVTTSTEIILSTFKPGRLYTTEDVRLRCGDKGYSFTPDAIKSGISELRRAGKVVCDGVSKDGTYTQKTIYRLSEVEG